MADLKLSVLSVAMAGVVAGIAFGDNVSSNETLTKAGSDAGQTREEALTAFREGVVNVADARKAIEARKEALATGNKEIASLKSDIADLQTQLTEKRKALSAAYAADGKLKELEKILAEEEDALAEARQSFRRMSSKRKP